MTDWQTTDIEVRIKETHDDSGLIGQTGIIRGVSVRNCMHTVSFTVDTKLIIKYPCTLETNFL